MRGLLVLVCCSATACAFDLSWIPADGEGPLPLSTSYRQQLARLCDIIESGSALPPSIAERRSDIEKMCAKLRVAERPRGFLRLGATLAGVALGGGYAWRNYESKGWLYKVVQDERRRQRLAKRYLSPSAKTGRSPQGSLFDP